MVVGVTGPYCSGKSTAARILEEAGFLSIDVDRLGHAALEARKAELVAAFGSGILDAAGRVDRAALGRIVFRGASPFRRSPALRRLEAIVHPRMTEDVKAVLAAQPEGDVVVNAALLFPMGLHRLCDLVVWVDAPFFVRFRRARLRDGADFPSFLGRVLSQTHIRPQKALEDVDIVRVGNGLDETRLRKALKELVDRTRSGRDGTRWKAKNSSELSSR